eukprot:PhF_6_TR12271/c0_g1_i2/m.19453
MTRKTQKPIAVVVGWLGSNPKQTSKYGQLYHGHRFDTVSVTPTLQDILNPRAGRAKMHRLIDNLTKKDEFKNRPLLFHCFSTGAYMYGNMILEAEKHDLSFLNRIEAQIFDSPVDYQQVPTMVPKVLLPNHKAIQVGASTSIRTLLKYSGNVQRMLIESSDKFYANPVTHAHSLFIYSADDEIGPASDVEKVVHRWTTTGGHKKVT